MDSEVERDSLVIFSDAGGGAFDVGEDEIGWFSELLQDVRVHLSCRVELQGSTIFVADGDVQDGFGLGRGRVLLLSHGREGTHGGSDEEEPEDSRRHEMVGEPVGVFPDVESATATGAAEVGDGFVVLLPRDVDLDHGLNAEEHDYHGRFIWPGHV